MSLSDLASIGSLVSGVAVLVSLVYLALQVRQTERNQRALMTHGAMTRATEFIAHYLQPDIADLFNRMRAGETDFSAREIFQLNSLLRMSVLSLRDVDLQRTAGLIDKGASDHADMAVRSMLRQPVMRAVWKGFRYSCAPEIVTMIEGLIENSPLMHPVDLVAQLKSNLAVVRQEQGTPHDHRTSAEGAAAQ
jgi:hypothetical protein